VNEEPRTPVSICNSYSRILEPPLSGDS